MSTCVEYEEKAHGYSGCVANFNGPNAGAGRHSERALLRLVNSHRGFEAEGGSRGEAGSEGSGSGGAHSTAGTTPAEREKGDAAAEPGLGEATSTEAGTEPLLNYLLGQ